MTSGSKPATVGPRHGAKAELAVVHLVRKSNGIEPLARFLDSYRRHRAGAEHELVLLLKGFADERDAEAHVALARDLEPFSLHLPDVGFDLGAYRRAAETLPHRRLALLNSFSEVLAEDWLGILLDAMAGRGVAAVAASGSWGSQVSHMRYELGLGGPYEAVFASRSQTHEVFARLAGLPVGATASPSLLSRLHSWSVIARQLVGFAQFPAPHLRTNGLLVGRLAWLDACRNEPRDKLAAHRMESGRRGITARLRAHGGELLLAGRDGRRYRCPEWPASATFWQGDQGNLLVADNQTNAYRDGDAVTRRVLAGYAWGSSAASVDPPVAEAA